jgi:hypothetical protein
MKKLFPIAILALLCLSSCFKEAQTQGYLGTNIYLQGADTLTIPIGQQVSTQKAWLDNSTKPVKFEITNIRDKFGERKEEFFKKSNIQVWNGPYDYLTDTTRTLIEQKLGVAEVTPIMINEVNGQLYTMSTTANCGLSAGDIFNVDVRVSNSKGSVDIKDYAVLKFTTGSSVDKFQLLDFVNGICVEYLDEGNETRTIFPYYDQINDSQGDFETRRGNVIADNGKEPGMVFHKIADTPAAGITLWVKMLDKNGKMFDPSTYATYLTTTSYIDVGIERVNDPEKGLGVSFPMTPWPVNDMYSYIRGPYYTDLSNLDTAALRSYYLANSTKASAAWNTSIFADGTFKAWYTRLRTRIRIYDPGTYELVITVPFTTAK